jgi:hypothetical protein
MQAPWREPWRGPSGGAALAGLVTVGLLWLWMLGHERGFAPIIDNANLAFHEAGHPFYGLFGETAALYGGTLGQLTFPLVAAAIFYVRREPTSFALALVWFFENFPNIARYAGDARAQELPLVGGGEHDWAAILGRWHALDSDLRVAATIRTIGWLGMMAAVGWLGYRWWRQR